MVHLHVKLCRLLRLPALPPLALLLIGLSGCEKDVTKNDYFPLRDGNRWEYRLLDMPLLKRLEDGQTVETAPSGSSKIDDTHEEDLVPAPSAKESSAEPAKGERPQFVAPDTKQTKKSEPEKSDAAAGPAKPGATQARRVTLELRDAVNVLTYRAKYDSSEQVWSKKNGYVGFQSNRGRSYLLILPPHTGYRWVAVSPAGQDLYFEIESAAAEVTTPAGVFRGCAVTRQESRDRKEIFRYWFAPDVGMVRRSKYFMNEEVFRQELVAFDVKPATPVTRQAEDKEVQTAVAGKNHGNEFRDKTAAERSRERRNERIDALDPPETNLRQEKVQKFGDPK